MKKKYEALAISFLVVNMIYSHGVVHLQPSIGDEIIGMLNKNLAFIDLGSIVIKSSTIRKVIVKELC